MTRLPQASQASACGKTIIIGEHAVVYGARAVAIPLGELRLRLNLRPLAQGSQPVKIELRLGGEAVSPQLRGVIDDALSLLDLSPFALAIDGQSGLPIGAGLGSSATLCVAILRAIATSVDCRIKTEELARLANTLERRFHGNPSGLDAAVVAYELPISFAKGAPVHALALPIHSHWDFALIDSGVRASTMAMIERTTPYFQGSAGAQRLDRFDLLAASVIQGLEDGAHNSVAAAMTEAGIYLGEAGIVTPLLDNLMAVAKEVGVMAAKPTGAGGGGVVLALLKPECARQQLSDLRKVFGKEQVYATSLSRRDSLDLYSGSFQAAASSMVEADSR